MIETYEMVKDSLINYKAKDIKIKRMSDSGEITKLNKGLYETEENTPGYLVANAIYSPSYLSFEYALARHGLIPETVYIYTSATFNKGKKKMYKNSLGVFTYRDVPSHIYPYGINLYYENNHAYAMASPEKALCDKLYTLDIVKNKEEMFNLLFNDLRIDKELLLNLDFKSLDYLCDNYRTTNMKYLKKVLGDLKWKQF